jgi:hypothetical protein
MLRPVWLAGLLACLLACLLASYPYPIDRALVLVQHRLASPAESRPSTLSHWRVASRPRSAIFTKGFLPSRPRRSIARLAQRLLRILVLDPWFDDQPLVHRRASCFASTCDDFQRPLRRQLGESLLALRLDRCPSCPPRPLCPPVKKRFPPFASIDDAIDTSVGLERMTIALAHSFVTPSLRPPPCTPSEVWRTPRRSAVKMATQSRGGHHHSFMAGQSNNKQAQVSAAVMLTRAIPDGLCDIADFTAVQRLPGARARAEQ